MATIPAFKVSLKARDVYDIIFVHTINNSKFGAILVEPKNKMSSSAEFTKISHDDFNLTLNLSIENKDNLENNLVITLEKIYSKDSLIKLIVEDVAKKQIERQVVDTLNYSIEDLRFHECNLVEKVEKNEDEVLGFTFTLTEDWHEMDR